MENNITDFIEKYNIKLVLPANSDRWECNWKNCGLCCITEKTSYHIKDKCSKFNSRTKECAIYSSRLVDCKFYPFMLIYTKDGVNLSPSLNCPYLLSSIKMNKLLITDILIEEDVIELLKQCPDTTRKLFQHLNIEIKNSDDTKIKQINDLLKQSINIKYLDDLKKFILNNRNFDIFQEINKKNLNSIYIQPNYSIDNIPNPLVMNLRLTNKNHIIFKSRINTKIIKEIIIPETIIINDPAQSMFKQYIELNINRKLEFCSLGTCRIQNPYNSNVNFESAYKEVMIKILVYMYIHLFLLVLRENVNIIDYPMMREALSMTDSRLNGIINPDILKII